MAILTIFSKAILRFLLPWACAGCRTTLSDLDDTGFCGRCWLSIKRLDGLICRFCGVSLEDGGNCCFSCRSAPPALLIRGAAVYQGALASALYRFKYGGRRSLGRPFSALMEQAWHRFPELQGADAFVPVPLHPRSRRYRGYNQAELLAEGLARSAHRPLLPDLLLRRRATKPQFNLDRSQRLSNLKQAFQLNPTSSWRARIPWSRFLLIDDICTTGATLQECARCLLRAGAASVQALVLARD